MDILGEDVGEKYDEVYNDLQSKYDNLLEKYETAQGNGYFNYGERDGKKEHEEIKKLFKLSKENLNNTNLNNRVVDKLDALNDYIEKLNSNFGKTGALVNLHGKLVNRAKEMSRIVAEKSGDSPFKTPMSTPSKTPKKKGKVSDFSPMPLPLDPEEKKEIEKMIENPEMKNQIVDKIMKAFPSFKREQLDALSVKDLLEISITLGFDFSNLNKLKAPENASNEVKELAQNLENLKREREIQEEFKRLQDRVQGEEAKTTQEKKEKLLKNAAKIIKQKLPKEEPFKVKIPKKSTEKSDAIIKKHVKDLLAAGNVSLEENFADIKAADFGAIPAVKTKKQKKNLSTKKSNPFLEFMKDFRKQNQGKFDSKSMMKEGGKAWSNLKCKTKECDPKTDQFQEFHKISRDLKKKNEADDETSGDTALAKILRKKLK